MLKIFCLRNWHDVGCLEVNRSAFYISQAEVGKDSEEPTNLKDFFMHLDSALAWRASYSDEEVDELPSKPKIKIFLEPELGFELEFKEEDEMECEMEVVSGSELTDAIANVSVFDVPPPTYPLRIVLAVFELKSENVVDLFFYGNVVPFQSGFQKMKIKGQSFKADPKQVHHLSLIHI